jgi:hypothetical protein
MRHVGGLVSRGHSKCRNYSEEFPRKHEDVFRAQIGRTRTNNRPYTNVIKFVEQRFSCIKSHFYYRNLTLG